MGPNKHIQLKHIYRFTGVGPRYLIAMLQQLLANVQRDTSFLLKEDSRGQQELLSIQYRILTGALSRSSDIDTILDDVFRPAKDTSSRTLHYKVMRAACCAHITTASGKKSLETRLMAVIEQMSHFVTAVQSDDEAAALLEVLGALLLDESEPVRARFERCLTKVCAAALALIEAGPSSRFGFLVLQSILGSAHRSYCQHSFSAIRNVSFEHLDTPEVLDVASSCAAMSIIADSPDNWTNHWKNYVFTIICIIQSMGIASNIPLPKGGTLVRELNLETLSGTTKALHCERMLRGCCKGLESMLQHGCATGPVSTDLSGFFACCHAVVSMQLDGVAKSDAKALVENVHGVSVVDILLVLSNIKICFLEFIQTVLTVTPPATLFPFAVTVFRSVAAAVSSMDMTTNPRYSLTVYECASDVISAFPTTIVKTGMFVDGLINQLKIETRRMTSAAGNVENAEIWRAEAVMLVIRRLLLFCGSVLTPDSRTGIEYCVAVGLACLAKGICSSYCSVVDRKVRRIGSMDKSGVMVSSERHRLVEPIRFSLQGQLALIKLATAEVLCPRAVGTLSGNISLLKLVAEYMSTHINVECRAESRSVLAILDGILHPSAIALSAVPMQTLVKSYLSQRNAAVAEGDGTDGYMDMDTDSSDRNVSVLMVHDLYGSEVSRGEASGDKVSRVVEMAASINSSVRPSDVMKAPFNTSSKFLSDNSSNRTGSENVTTGAKRSLATMSSDPAGSEDDIELPDIVD